jgi:hypothetical protein
MSSHPRPLISMTCSTFLCAPPTSDQALLASRGDHVETTMRGSGGGNNPGSPHRVQSAAEDDDDDDTDDDETRGLGEAQSMSVATSDEDYDGLTHSQRHDRWRRGILRGVGGGNSTQDYSYDYIDENVYVGQGGFSCLIPTGKVRLLIAVFIVASVLVVFIPRQKETKDNVTVHKYKGVPDLVCPETPDLPSHHIFYTNTSQVIQRITNDFTSYRDEFPTLEYRDWGVTYDAVKEGVRTWKKERFAAHLANGDSIFESGCGVGLNLLMTLEILQEEDIRDIHLYGSTFGEANAANFLLDGVLTKKEEVGSGKRGIICSASSSDLLYVPDNTFDLVFTGHVSSQPDPWSIGQNETIVLAHRDELCKGRKTGSDWKADTLLQVAQHEQDLWYALWLQNMVRIAKPGAAIIIEQVSDAYCSNGLDTLGGGVRREFWPRAIEEYDMDVDLSTVEFESDALFPKLRRYNVFMRKNR